MLLNYDHFCLIILHVIIVFVNHLFEALERSDSVSRSLNVVWENQVTNPSWKKDAQ